jgi:hypothetical protein
VLAFDGGGRGDLLHHRRRRTILLRQVARPVHSQVAHDAIEIADRLQDAVVGRPLALNRGGEAQIGFLHHVLGARPAAGDRLGIVDQRSAMREEEVEADRIRRHKRRYQPGSRLRRTLEGRLDPI